MDYKYIIDLDGTLYHQNVPIKYADTFIHYLSMHNRSFALFTNSPERTPLQLSEKLQGMGIYVSTKDIITTGCIALDYFENQKDSASIFILGTVSFKERFIQAGYHVVCNKEEKADYVLCGFSKDITFQELTIACQHIWDGATLISTNSDQSIPTECGLIPHTGSYTAFLEYATGTKAIQLGKPGAYAYEYLRKHLDASVKELCMIGDNLPTDMLFGKNNGFSSYLVLTGLTNKEIASKNTNLFDKSFNNLKEIILFEQLQAYQNTMSASNII